MDAEEDAMEEDEPVEGGAQGAAARALPAAHAGVGPLGPGPSPRRMAAGRRDVRLPQARFVCGCAWLHVCVFACACAGSCVYVCRCKFGFCFAAAYSRVQW